MELADSEARKAAVEAALAQPHQLTHALEPPGQRRSPRRSPSLPSEVAAPVQLLQRHDKHHKKHRREAAEREDRLEARLLRTPSTATVGYRIGAAAKEFRPLEGEHLRNFLNEQGPATTGDRRLGPHQPGRRHPLASTPQKPPPRLRGEHHPQRQPPWTGRPWWRASRPNTR